VRRVLLGIPGVPVQDSEPIIFGIHRRASRGAGESLAREGIVTAESLGRIYSAAEKLEMLKRKVDPVRTRNEFCRRIKNNPVLLGEAGVGKTAIIEGLAQEIAAGKKLVKRALV
jgi:hypothetical protein